MVDRKVLIKELKMRISESELDTLILDTTRVVNKEITKAINKQKTTTLSSVERTKIKDKLIGYQ